MPFDIPAPKLCSICKRPAFLTCIDCDTIYCSAICQVEDWTEHQNLPAHINKTRSTITTNCVPSSVKTNKPVVNQILSALNKAKSNRSNFSVQHRLKLAAAKFEGEHEDTVIPPPLPPPRVVMNISSNEAENQDTVIPPTSSRAVMNVSSNEAEDQDTVIPPPPPSPVQLKQENQVEEKRYTIKDIKLKVLKPGKVKLSFLDGSRLAEGKMCICESLNENVEFFEVLEKDISNYVKANPNAGGYVPIVYELVLSKFTDGNYYRAMCLKVDEIGCSVAFLEYGNELYITFGNIIKMPESLLRKSVSRVISIKLASGRDISEIDIDASIDRFLDNQEFEAIVHDDVKSATVNDSFFIFKK